LETSVFGSGVGWPKIVAMVNAVNAMIHLMTLMLLKRSGGLQTAVLLARRFGNRRSLSNDRSRNLTFPEQELIFGEMRLFGIAANVANAIDEMFFIAHQPVEVIALPEISRSFEQFVDLPRAETLPTANQYFERPRRILNKERMNMIRHDHKRNHHDAVTSKVK
jgi:hypothetical protein